ncbi:hypothetical protein N7532_008384 [Penicillium argentinense]|uniref:2-methylcitrate dehydratase n=1 Tax=Penicillium argentinense TaxID=1131581 RepID=A0A9W9K1U5_9EURO|nr:uncharacterized protein N7532_008384 [Penicillium argentinense]KAJ5089700.1 hypothetical protein N7532_008384 [Penicillium argentinense]
MTPYQEPLYDKAIADVADYVFHYRLDASDEHIWEIARMALLDALGCAIETAATITDCWRLLEPIIPNTRVPDGFRVPGTRLEVDPIEGAFDLGVLIRYLDHNDALGGAEWGHPSDNLAAILPVMDWLSHTSNYEHIHTGPALTMRTLLIALIKAYEIQGCYQMRNAFNTYGIDHVVLVKLASAAVVSWLMGLTKEQTMASISHVWMDGQPSRTYRSRDHTIPRKGWAAGDAARRAVQLSLYVRAGQPGVSKALSAKPWGFLAQTFGENGFEFPRPFGTWTIQNVFFKTMPVEGHGISAVEAALLQLRRMQEQGLSDPARHIERIELRTTAAADLIIHKSGPLRNAADRDHCIKFVVSLSFLKGNAPVAADYSNDSQWAVSEDLERLRERIVVHADSQLTQDYLDLSKKSISTGVTVVLVTGKVLPEILVEYPIGHVRNAQTKPALHEKFLHNMAHMFSETETGKVLETVRDMNTPITELVNLLARPVAKAKL